MISESSDLLPYLPQRSSAVLPGGGISGDKCAEIGRVGGRTTANYPTQAKTRLEWATCSVTIPG
jgi:hypothetical protein